MALPWMLLGCLGEFGLALSGLVLFMRWRERGLIARLGSRMESLQDPIREETARLRSEVASLSEVHGGPAAAQAGIPSVPPASHRPDFRAAAVDLHRRGERPDWIAAALGIPRADVKMMLLVHDRIKR